MDCLPTFYDSFYNNFQIAQRITEIDKIKKQFKDLEVPFNTAFRGYTYFVEIVIINLLLNLESLIQDENLRDRIKWGDNTLEDQDVKKILSDHPEGKYLIELNSIRRDLAKIRNRDIFNEKELVIRISDLREKLFEVDKKIQLRFSVNRINNNSLLEKKLLLYTLVANYNYIRFNVDFDSHSTVGEPLFPGDLTFYLMPKGQRQNYFLCNDRIDLKKSQYLAGYRVCLFSLYSNIMPSKKGYFLNIFSGVNDWIELHRTYDTVLNDLRLDKIKNRQLFDMTFKPTKRIFEKETIQNYDDLKEVLRNRRTRFFENFDLDESILIHYFFGAIKLIKRGAEGENSTKLEIIELVVRESGFDRLVYFALFNPIRGGYSDGSHWLFFRDNEEVCSVTGKTIRKYSESHSDIIDYHRHTILDEVLIEKYKNEHTYGIKREKQKNEVLKSSRGLIGEFISLFYLLKQNSKEKIADIDCHREISETDIDVLFETTDKTIVGQVKPYLSLNPDERKSILKNFSIIDKYLQKKKKPVSKILFLMSREIPDSEIIFAIEDLPIDEGIIPIEKRELEELAEFTKNQIKIIYLDEIFQKLESEGNYSGLINQMIVIFIKKEFDPFDKERYLWE